jgi:hypothetical protein
MDKPATYTDVLVIVLVGVLVWFGSELVILNFRLSDVETAVEGFYQGPDDAEATLDSSI